MSGRALVATASQTVGPFFSFGLTTNAALGRLVQPGAAGEHVRLRVAVIDGAGEPVPDAVVEAWHVDHAGQWVFGRLGTDPSGVCVFETIRPPAVESRDAAHVNLCVFMRGLLRHLFTRLYFAGDPALDCDPILRDVAGERRATLLAHPDAARAATWTFEIRLQGDRETVYFDF